MSYKHTNSASRLHQILRSCQKTSGPTVLNGWATVFGISEENERRKARLVSERLQWMHEELDSLAQQVATSGYTEPLYRPMLVSIEHAIGIANLTAQWGEATKHISEVTLTRLLFFVELLPDEEIPIDAEELSKIEALLTELAEFVESTEIPDQLRRLIAHHVDLIREAISKYPIKGATVFRGAAHTAIGEIIEAKDVIQQAAGTPAVSKLQAAWKRINEIGDTALKGEKLAQIGQKAWAYLAELIRLTGN